MKNNILIKPVITEKSMQDAANFRYTFAVAYEANKAEIAQSVSANFNVKVVSVKTMILKGKTRHSGKTRQEVQTSDWKKAVVEVEKGQKINLFDTTENAQKT